MDNSKRQMIKDNLQELVSKTNNFDRLFKELNERKLFNEFMVEEILRQNDEDKMLYLYNYITTRGPKAFEHLKNALIHTGNIEAASLLNGVRPFRGMRGDISGEAVERESEEVEERGHGETEEERSRRELTVTKGQQRMDGNRDKAYKMGSRPKGHALIINIRTYVNNIETERLGSEQDVRALKTVLAQLGYETYAVPNEQLEDYEFLDVVRKFSKKTEHNDCDSSIVVIMCHGTTDPISNSVKFKCYNGKDVWLQDVINMFSAERCAGLANKPKLFFVQVCRGDMPHAKVHVGNGTFDAALQTDGGAILAPSLVRNFADILIGHSTIQGYVSYRDTTKGSWFIQELCKALARLAHNTDLSTIMEQVDLNVSSMERGQFAQTTDTNNLLSKKVYFNPGLYDNDDYKDDPHLS